DKRQLYSQRKLEELGKPKDAITRGKQHFEWAQGANVLLLDYDPRDGHQALTKAELIEKLTEVVPELSAAAYVWWCSSSSLIYNDRDQLAGVKGQRVYVLVKDAQDIERAGKALFERLWLAGHGHYEVSRAGSALE